MMEGRWTNKMPTDLIYHSLRNSIIHSYQSGEMDDTMGQMEASLAALDDKYSPALFRHGNIQEVTVKLLNEIQAHVDSILGKKIYSDMWE